MATIDPSIALGVKPIQIEDPINRFARQQELSVNMLKGQEAQQAIQDRNMLRQLDPSAKDYIQQVGRVNPKLALELQKGQLDTKKLMLETEAAYMKNARNTLAPIQDQATYDIWRQQTSAQLPGLAQFLPAKFDNNVKTSLMLEADKYIQQTQVSEYQKQDLGLKRERLAKDTDPTLQANLASAREYGQTLGKNKAVAEQALPSALQAAEEGIRLIDEMVGKAPVKDASGKVIQAGTKPHPGFKNYVGAALVPGMRFIEGSDTASYEVRQKQIEGKAFLEAFQALKGGGSITEKEGEKGTQAIMRMNKASKESEYIAAARELQGILRTGMDRARAKAGQTSPVVPNAAPAAPRPGLPAGSENVIDFNSLK